jgi:hypothetical protein
MDEEEGARDDGGGEEDGDPDLLRAPGSAFHPSVPSRR